MKLDFLSFGGGGGGGGGLGGGSGSRRLSRRLLERYMRHRLDVRPLDDARPVIRVGLIGAGLFFGLFLIWHLFELTFTGTGYHYVRGEAYQNVDGSLSRIPVALLYIVANLALGVHLFHGAWSLFQSLGLNNPRFNAWRRNFAAAFAAIVVIGNVSFPIAVLAGVVGS